MACREVLRDREDVVMIAPQEKGIVFYKLRSPNEVRKIDEVPQLDSKGVDKDQLKLARNLGLGAVNRIGPLKRVFMRHAMGSIGNLPKLLRGEAL